MGTIAALTTVSHPLPGPVPAAYVWVMSKDTSVLYNGDCPVCSFEMTRYAAYSKETGLPIRFDDLNKVDLACYGIDADTAAQRLHVLHDGRVLSSIDAFVVLWQQMPRYRWLARLVTVPGLRQIADVLYDRVVAPIIYRRHVRRQQRAALQNAG